MDFGQALKHLKDGHKVARAGWNGKGMFIYLVNGTKVFYENLRGEAAKHLEVSNPTNSGKTAIINSHIDMKATDGSIVVGWSPSQADMLAEDWEVVK